MASLPSKTDDSQHLVRGILKTMLQVEDEAAAIKARTGRQTNWPMGRVRLDPVVGEDMAIALQVIQRVKEEQAEEERLKKYKYIHEKKPAIEYDPRVAIEERHRKIEEKRRQRKHIKADSVLNSVVEAKNSSRDSRSTPEDRLSKLRHRQKELEAELDPEALRAIKEDVRREAAEMKDLDLAVRRQKAQFEEMQKIQQTRDELAREKEERQRTIRDLHTRQLLNRIQTVFDNNNWKLSSWSLRQLCEYSLELKSKEMKFQSKLRLMTKARSWAFWRKTTREVVVQRELKAIEEEHNRERAKLESAILFESVWRARRVLVEWLKAVKQLKVEREAEKEAEDRRKKIDKMMMFVKAHTEARPSVFDFENEEEESEPQTVLHIHTKTRPQLKTYSQSISIVGRPTRQPEYDHPPIEFDTDQSQVAQTPEFNEGFISSHQESTSQLSEHSRDTVQSAASETTSTNSKRNAKVPKELEKMKAREDERRRRRESLEAKYKAKQEEEALRKKEAEQKAQEEEKKRKREVVLKKKQAEAEKLQKEEQKLQEALKAKQLWNSAVAHKNQRVAASVLKGFSMAVASHKSQFAKAEHWNDSQVCRVINMQWGLNMLSQAVAVLKETREQEEAKNEMEAWFVYLEHLQVLTLRGLTERIVRRRSLLHQAEQFNEQKLKYKAVRCWQNSHQLELAEEAAIENDAFARIEAFRKVNFT